MKLLVVLSTLAAFAHAASAAECSTEQRAAANVLSNDAAFEKACAAALDNNGDGSASFDPSAFSTLDMAALQTLSSCQDPTCASYLKTKMDKVPDCTLHGVNVRVVFKSIVDFCSRSAPSSSDSSDSSASNSLLSDSSSSDTDSDSASALADGSDESGILFVNASEGSSSASTAMETVSKPSSDSKSTVKKSAPSGVAATATTAPPAAEDGDIGVGNANTKSDAPGAVYAGATALVAGAMLSVLLM